MASQRIVPGEPSGKSITNNNTPFHRLNDFAASSRPNNGCVSATTRTSHGKTARNCCSLSPSLPAPASPTCSSGWGWRPANKAAGSATSPLPQLVNELVEAADERVLSRVVARYGRLDLLCLDELGYVQIDPRGAELLFQIITEREERASVAIATNLPFSEWGTVFPDPRLVAAIVDRVTFNAHIIETGTQSYRLRTSKTATRRKRAS